MNRKEKEPCDVCQQVGGYCGGSAHPSCGCFLNGFAVSLEEEMAAKKNRPLIVSRHQGLVDWLKCEGIEGEVVSHVSDPSILEGRRVFGVLPLFLAVHAASVTEVAMPSLRPEQRGKDLTIEEMDEAGAHLLTYVVRTKSQYDDDIFMANATGFGG